MTGLPRLEVSSRAKRRLTVGTERANPDMRVGKHPREQGRTLFDALYMSRKYEFTIRPA